MTAWTRYRPRSKRGFAIVMTVLLLGLLVVVLVSLATVTRVETGIAGNTRRFSQARQNAVMALNIAIGELQAAAGPDQRVTATANITDATVENPHWTGVWDSDGGAFIKWLVSGDMDAIGDADNVVDPDPNQSVLLVGSNSAGTDPDNHIRSWLENINAPYPGLTGDPVSGRYAWWIGDEGVKASMALPDLWNDVDYGPYQFAENRRRLRQQVPFVHEHFRDAAIAFGFDPADSSNHTASPNVIAREQLRFLDPLSSAGPYTTFIKEGFHSFTHSAYGVLASTNPAYPGLKRDVSVDSSLLGATFAAWHNHGNYMEDPSSPLSPTAVPALTSENDYRRRYPILAPIPSSPATDDLVFSVAPVLSEFVIQFGIEPVTPTSVNVTARIVTALWNPHTSALIPEPLRLEVAGLPNITIHSFDALGAEIDFVEVPLQDAIAGGAPFVVSLPFSPWDTAEPGSDWDRSSWLPGRVYNWRSPLGVETSPEPVPELVFYAKSIELAHGWQYSYTPTDPLPTGERYEVSGAAGAQLSVALTMADGTPLATYGPTPEMSAWLTEIASDQEFDPAYWIFGFGFRLHQPTTAGTGGDDWLAAGSNDPRSAVFAALDPYFPGVAWDPGAFVGHFTTDWDGIDFPGYLLNRPWSVHADVPAGDQASWRYTANNDVPLFELPRTPVLSLGMLQHLQLAENRPFSIGNSWSADVEPPGVSGGGTIGSWFDRFFFSGVPPTGWGPDLSTGEPFPYYHLRAFTPDGLLDLTAFRAAPNATTSRHLLMAGAFNVNSTSVAAWEAVLKSLRPDAIEEWFVVEPNPEKGGPENSPVGYNAVTDGVASQAVTDSTQGSSSPANRAFGFVRFSQSAQETFLTDDGAPGATPSSEAPSGFNRSNYRQGFRGGDSGADAQTGRNLDSTDITTLATAIVTEIRDRGTPFLSMEEFMGPASGGSSPSVLEDAIDNAGINTGLGDEFCSYWLTQADVLTAIAPMLQARSDTFVVRAYGESVNPITDDVEGRAWCEATVQRIPTPVAEGDPIDDPPGPLGRRFQIVSFRWLTPADI